MNKCYWLGHSYRKTNAEDDNYVRRYSHVCKNCEERSDRPDLDKYKNTFWDSEMLVVIKIVGSIVLALLAGIAVIILLDSVLSRKVCLEYLEMGIKTKWSFWTSCMGYSEKFGWLPIDQYFNAMNLNIPK